MANASTKSRPPEPAVVEQPAPQPEVVPTTPAPIPELDCGDVVYVVFWRPFEMSDDPGHGFWEYIDARFVSMRRDGTRVCVEISNPSMFGIGDEAYVVGSSLRFVPGDKVFRSSDEAQKVAGQLPRPK